jgi:hypothetical protein
MCQFLSYKNGTSNVYLSRLLAVFNMLYQIHQLRLISNLFYIVLCIAVEKLGQNSPNYFPDALLNDILPLISTGLRF